MTEIAALIQQLHSTDKNRRYEACEFLRVKSVLPPAALEALEQATHDPDAEVAEDARHALELHLDLRPESVISTTINIPETNPLVVSVWGMLGITLTSFFVMMWAILSRAGEWGGVLFIIGTLPGLPLAVMGALIAAKLINKQKTGLRVILALLAGPIATITPFVAFRLTIGLGAAWLSFLFGLR